MDIDTLYLNIKKRREELGMSQEELAAKLNYKHRSSINKIELGVNDLPQSKIKEFAMALDTTVPKLMGWCDIDDSGNAFNVRMQDQSGENTAPLLLAFAKLNDIGQAEAVKRVEELTEISRYTEKRNERVSSSA